MIGFTITGRDLQGRIVTGIICDKVNTTVSLKMGSQLEQNAGVAMVPFDVYLVMLQDGSFTQVRPDHISKCLDMGDKRPQLTRPQRPAARPSMEDIEDDDDTLTANELNGFDS